MTATVFQPLIKGGWQLASGHATAPSAAPLNDMAAFVQAGITTFDCADIYTGVESLIGEFRRAQPHLVAGLRVHTKYVPDLASLGSLGRGDVERIIDRSRDRLGVATLDLVQLHWWDYAQPHYVAAGQALWQLREVGKIAAVGATNFDTPRLAELLDAGVPVVSHQVQYSLLDRRPARQMVALCQSRGVQLLCYGSIAGGFLSERWLGSPEPHGPFENRSLVKYKLIIDECGGWAAFQRGLRTISLIAEEHGVTIGTIAVRWVLDQPGVASAIVGARTSAHIASLQNALAITLTPAQHDALNHAFPTSPPGDVYDLERDRTGPHGRIMRYNLASDH